MGVTGSTGGADKADLRDEFGQRRRGLTQPEIEAARTRVRDAVLARAADARWSCVAAYVPLRTEPGSTQLLDALVAAGVRVLIPLVLDDRDLDWTPWPSGVTGEESAPLGVAAIAEADVVLVPALAVAHDGTRLGRGGGSYDRSLARVTGELPIVALLYTEEFVHELPSEPWDIPVTAVVTPDGWTELPFRRP
jgi:5-formyltetrahydrofolate cyclo-ligase